MCLPMGWLSFRRLSFLLLLLQLRLWLALRLLSRAMGRRTALNGRISLQTSKVIRQLASWALEFALPELFVLHGCMPHGVPRFVHTELRGTSERQRRGVSLCEADAQMLHPLLPASDFCLIQKCPPRRAMQFAQFLDVSAVCQKTWAAHYIQHY